MTAQLMSPEDLLKEAKELVADRASLCRVSNVHASIGNDEICEWKWSDVRGGELLVVVSAASEDLKIVSGGQRRIKPKVAVIIHRIQLSRHKSEQQLLYFHFERPYWEIGCDRERTHLGLLVDKLKSDDVYHQVAG